MVNIKKIYTGFTGGLRRFFYKTAKQRYRKMIINLSKAAGSSSAFTAAFLIVFAWAACGPYFHYSDTWQLVINTGTTIVTFLVAFSIQFTQNRDTKEIKLILRSLMEQNKDLRDQLAVIEKELDEDDT
jgi:low affinity Fe/Cu permease